MTNLQTAVLVLMFCLFLKKSATGRYEVKRNHGSNDAQVDRVRGKRATTCKDYYNYQTCYYYYYNRQCSHVRYYCQKTCGICKVLPSVTKPPVAPTNCRNKNTKLHQCDDWAKKGFCTDARYTKWMAINCAQSCDRCPCQDKHKSCSYWAGNNECQKNPNYMLQNCQKSCRVCTRRPVTKPTPKRTPKPTPKPTQKLTRKPATTVPTTITVPTTNPTTVGRRICGHSSTLDSRIVGGIFAQPGEWPWYAALTSCLNCTKIPFCGGTLINNDWIVTAAHCVSGVLPSEIFVLLGETNVLHKSRHEVVRKVQAIYIHPKYAIAARYDYDVALLKLSTSVKFTHYIQPACLPHLNPKFPVGLNCTVTGFGRTTERGSKSPRLKQAKVPLVSQAQCKKPLSPSGSLRITSNMLCAGHAKGGIDSCQGDSGGPLMCKSSDGSYELAGVVSWGKGCARANQYGVYADMQVLRGWLETEMATRAG